jgi:hypothetical protein
MRSERHSDAGDLYRTSNPGPRSSTNSKRQRATRAADLSPVPPLHWWRRLSADAFTTAHVAVVRGALSGISILSEPHWRDAVRGNPAAAIGVALRTAKRRDTPAPVIDLVMSAVLLAGLAGDCAAVLVLINMIGRKGAKIDKNQLQVSWSSAPNSARYSTAGSEGGSRPAIQQHDGGSLT